MLGLATSEVNNLIDEIAQLGVARAGRGTRTVEYRGLFAMLVAKELIHGQLKPAMRQQTLVQALRSKAKRIACARYQFGVVGGSGIGSRSTTACAHAP